MNFSDISSNPFWIHDLSPIIVELGPLQLRYYGILFSLTILIGFYFWYKQIIRSGRDENAAYAFLWMGVAGVVIGSRLGHVLFYEPDRFIQNPLHILYIWRGGLASHGAAIGILTALWAYSRRYNMTMTEACDRFSISVTVGATLVRIGNFFNSEIVGRASEVPWAVVFTKYDRMMGLPPTARHPSQLYEAAMAIVVFLVLFITDRKLGEDRPPGLMVGILLAGYFTLRFFVEYFKEYQALSSSFPFTMGQLLSIPFAAAGYIILIKILLKKRKKDL
ncbi:MAG: prolipoprotein diacylglyceryl transferase [Nitrospiraceae bacterium]|nr:MAG: prolipoprotein diacylglyceryl transferase [Nitrospiraceae bacterium]